MQNKNAGFLVSRISKPRQQSIKLRALCNCTVHTSIQPVRGSPSPLALLLISLCLAPTCSEFQTQLSRELLKLFRCSPISNSESLKWSHLPSSTPCPLTICDSSHSLDPATQLPDALDSDSQTKAASSFPLPSLSGWSFIALHA